MSVVNLPRPERQVWICGCGCASFDLHADGGIECAGCQAPVGTDEFSGWHDPLPDRDYEGEAPTRDVHGNGSIEFARHRVGRLATDEDVAAIVVVKDDGAVSTWAVAEDREQARWTMGRLLTAARMIRKRVEQFVDGPA